MEKEEVFKLVEALEEIRIVIESFVDSKGNIRDKPIGKMENIIIKEQIIYYARNLVDFLLNMIYLNKVTRMCLKNRNLSTDYISNYMVKKGDKYFKDKTLAKVLILNDMRLIDTHIGVNSINRIFTGEDITGEEKSKLLKAISKYSSKNELCNINLNIPEYTLVTEIADEIFENQIKLIEPYTISNIKQVETQLDSRMWGYCMYILNSRCLSEVDREKRDRLKKILDS